MTTPAGGERDRLIWQALTRWLHGYLDALGWFGPLVGPDGPAPSIQWQIRRIPDDAEVPVNTLAVSTGPVKSSAMETGSNMSEEASDAWVDFYASYDELGKHVAGDVAAILRGQYPSIGAVEPGFGVYERPLDPLDVGDLLFWVDIEDVQQEHESQHPATPELRFWYAVAFRMVDERP